MTPADIRKLADDMCDCLTCKTLLACADVVEAAESVSTRLIILRPPFNAHVLSVSTRLMVLRPPFNAHVLNDALARLEALK